MMSRSFVKVSVCIVQCSRGHSRLEICSFKCAIYFVVNSFNFTGLRSVRGERSV